MNARSDRPSTLLSTALQGLSVLELSAGLAGEQCGHALAGLGATVTAVRATGEPAHPLDAHKRVVNLDPATDSGFAELARMAASVDLFIEDRPAAGWLPGGSLATRLVRSDARLIAVCLSPFGLTGPYANFSAHPLNIYHAGGNAQQIPCDALRPEYRDRAPLQAGGQWGEAQAGTLAAVAALACLLNQHCHAGTIIDCAKQEALISYNWTEVARFPNEGRSPSRLAPLATIVGGILPTRDGHVQIAVREDHQWAALAQLLDRPEWIDDPRYATRAARISRWQEVANQLAVETHKHSSHHLHFNGRARGIPIAAVMSPADLLADRDLAARGVWETVKVQGHEIRLPRWDTKVTQPCASPQSTQRQSTQHQRTIGIKGRPLSGLRVLDVGWVAMGPYAGYTLAGLGAEVIHIARPSPGRAGSGVDLAAYNYGFDTLNTGKTWVALDLKHPAGIEQAHALVSRVDIVLENFRPGVADRLGLGYATLAKINPRLVMLSASTYGARDMDGAYVGYAPVFSALGGLAQATGYPDGPPSEVSHPVDFFAGSVGVAAILAGLHRLAAMGNGCHIDFSAREAVLWSLSQRIAFCQSGARDARGGNTHPDMAPHGVYRCRGENRWISIAIGSDDEWRRFCQVIGSADLAHDPRYATRSSRIENALQIDALAERWTAQQEVWSAFAQLQAAEVAAFPTVTSEDLWNDRHIQAREILLSSATGTRWYVAAPWRYAGLARQPLVTVRGAEAIERVFADVLGMPAERIEALRSTGVIGLR